MTIIRSFLQRTAVEVANSEWNFVTVRCILPQSSPLLMQ